MKQVEEIIHDAEESVEVPHVKFDPAA